jgi:hypothetical protein
MSDPAPAPQRLSPSQTYPARKPDYINSNQTCPTPSLDMSGLSVLSQVKAHNRTPLPGSREVYRTCPAPTRICLGLWHPNGQIPLGAIKDPPRLSSSIGHSVQLANTLRHSFLSSNPLSISLKIHSNLSFIWEIWSSLLSDSLDLQHKHFIDDLCVFVTLGNLSPRQTRCYPGVTKVVVDLEKFVLPSPSWRFDIRNWIRSWWSFREV